MMVCVDDGEYREVLNHVRVILGDGSERHITITHEGIVIDLIEAGEVVDSQSIEHEALLPSSEED